MAGSQQPRQHLEQLLEEAYILRVELEQKLLVTSGPVERANLRLDLQKVKDHIARLEAELEALKQKNSASSQPATGTEQPSYNAGKSTSATENIKPASSQPTSELRRLKVFLCHSSGDKERVRELYHRLKADGFDPWLDEENLLPGQDWREEIEKAVETTDVVIVCLTPESITKEGYVQREIKVALDAAGYKPEETIFIIPLKFRECQVPRRFRQWQWVDYFPESQQRGYERLVKALNLRATKLDFEPTFPATPAPALSSQPSPTPPLPPAPRLSDLSNQLAQAEARQD